MSRVPDHGRSSPPWSNNEQNSSNGNTTMPVDSGHSRLHRMNSQRTSQSKRLYSVSPPGATRPSDRPQLPTRSSTIGYPVTDHRPPANDLVLHARSEDLNHGSASNSYGTDFSGSSPRPSPAFLASAGRGSRSSPPAISNKRNQPSSSSHSDDSDHRMSVASLSSAHSSSSSQSGGAKAPPASSSNSTSLSSTICSACGKTMQGPFVRALGTVSHLNCFKCMDCGDVVASKFFPIDGPDGRQQPLCERDYFRRLNLICAKCGTALRGSYITACNKKFHVEHFTCSLCPTLFGPQDSYYEHDGDVYCHFHYSTRFATKCAGCNSAILKQFVEINRNMRDECWHPECYMINKFWNVKVVSRRPSSSASIEGEPEQPAYIEEEQKETSVTLKEKQVRMEQQVYRIWTVLSAFEESSAACISDMLRQVSNGQYLEAIRMAEKFILHVEVLFATIDDLEYHFARLNLKGMSHVREARMLCRKTVELFTLLSHTQETGSRRMGMTQELLALVTGLAHYLKILIRIALTGALKLEREYSVREAMSSFLDKLHLLAVQGGNPTARRLIKGANGEVMAPPANSNFGTQGVTYGFRSLAPENAGESPFAVTTTREGASKFSATNPPSDLCVKCNLTVEEDCVRLGTYQRWHSHCVQCATCGKVAAVQTAKDLAPKNGEEKEKKELTKENPKEQPPKLSTARRPPANVGIFVYDPDSRKSTNSFGDVPTVILCTDHAHPSCRGGFHAVPRLEQYAFLLNVALRRLYLLLKKQGVVPMSPASNTIQGQAQITGETDPYRNSADIMRMKSHLDRKLSSTARLPKRSTIVESPTGKTAQPSDVIHSQRTPELSTPQPERSITQVAQPQVPQAQGQQGQQGHPPTPSLQAAGRTPPTQHAPYNHQTPRQNPGRVAETRQQNQVVRLPVARDNTEAMIADESTPNSPAGGDDQRIPTIEDGITLANLPQLMVATQAREQQRREHSTPYIAELSALELAIVKHAAVLALSRSPLKDQLDLDELLELVEVKKSGFWNKLFKAGDKKNVKKKGVFGVPLELLVEKEGADSLLGASRATLRVPSFIDDVISAMRQMDMSVEGIFRKNGNIRRLKELTEAIDRDPSSVDLSQDNPVQLAALLKKFLRDLPDPLMTFKLHRLFVASQALPQEADRKRLLHLLSLIMPKSHRDTLEVIFVFLKWVACFAHMDEETGSKMDLGNLATVICPSILYSRGRDAVRDESFSAIRVVTTLLENQDEFFTVPEEFRPILHDQDYFANSMDLPSKDFMKKCDAFMRGKAANGRTPLGTPFASSSSVNTSTPRFQSPSSPNLEERPPMPAAASSEWNLRLNPSMAPSSTAHSLTSSPSTPQGMTQNPSRTPQTDDWPATARPSNPNTSSSRPSSFVQTSRASADHTNAFNSNHGNYPSAVRQRI